MIEADRTVVRRFQTRARRLELRPALLNTGQRRFLDQPLVALEGRQMRVAEQGQPVRPELEDGIDRPPEAATVWCGSPYIR